MGATFSRLKTWIQESLTFADLNAEFDNILQNLTPEGIDDESPNNTAMRATTDPYPAGAESLPTSLQGELQRLRYVLAQLSGGTYWYSDPLSAPAIYVKTMTGNETVTAVGVKKMSFLNPDGVDRTYNPTGTYVAGYHHQIINTGGALVTFDSTGLGQAIGPGQVGNFFYDGSAWWGTVS